MKISVVGTGYVGIVTAVCFAELGNEVVCVDLDKSRINDIRRGVPPVYESKLERFLKKNRKRINATTDYGEIAKTDFSFICVPTPSLRDGSIDLSFLKECVEDLSEIVKNKKNHIVVVKSTVVPRTTEEILLPFFGERTIVNPEFLKEGNAINDFLKPGRIIIGCVTRKTGRKVAKLYEKIPAKIFYTDLRTAEMVKYATNAFLATKISFSNEIGNICKKLEIDTYEVMKLMSLDPRISPEFLRSGVGFGGSCFPKDLKALIRFSEKNGYFPHLLRSVLKVNELQPGRMLSILREKVGSLKGKKIAVLGLSFKPDTDDVRDSRAIPVIRSLLKEGAKTAAYDPLASENMKKIFPDIDYCVTPRDALTRAHACLVLTDWEEFSSLEKEFDLMKNKLIIDGRRIIKRREGIHYEGICW